MKIIRPLFRYIYFLVLIPIQSSEMSQKEQLEYIQPMNQSLEMLNYQKPLVINLNNYSYHMYWSDDNSKIIVSSYDHKTQQVFKANDGFKLDNKTNIIENKKSKLFKEVLSKIKDKEIYTFSIFNDLSKIAYHHEDCIKIINADYQELHTLSCESIVDKIALSPDDSKLAAKCDNKIIIYDTQSFQILHTVETNNRLTSIAWSDSSKLFYVISNNNIQYFCTSTNTQEEIPNSNFTGNFSANNKYLAFENDGNITIWDIANKVPFKIIEPQGKVSSLSCSPDGSKLAFIVYEIKGGSDLVAGQHCNFRLIIYGIDCNE